MILPATHRRCSCRRAQRRGLLALYAFNVEISRVREQVSQPLPGEIRLQWWTDMLAGAGHGGVEGNPVAAELLLAIRNWGLPVERLSRLIDEHQFDLYNDPMPTMAALEGYINDTSSALFSLAARIAGSQSDEIEHLARHAGLAQGITQVLAALPLDASRRQSFVPLQLLESNGTDLEAMFAGKPTPKLRAALNQLVGEAQAHLKTALALLATAPSQAKPVFPAAGAGGPQPPAYVTSGQRSLCASGHLKASDLMDIVAGSAVAAVLVR